MSDQQQAAAEAHYQLQQQQERYTDLQAQHASEQSNAAAAAGAAEQQLEEGHQLVHQLQQQLNASRQQEAALQDSCSDYVKQAEKLTMEQSAADASAQAAQVGSAVLSNNCPLFRCLHYHALFCGKCTVALLKLSCCE